MLIDKIKRIFAKRKFYFSFLKWCLLITFLIIVFSNFYVEYSARKHVYSSTDLLPDNKVGLLLGTSKYKISGGLNPYYYYRIVATVRLIKLGKIKYIIVSGDNSEINYNEPKQMKDDLVKLGVDPNVIFLDYAGFRTLDSVVRSKEIFGQTSITIISQAFHNKRAIVIANFKHINAIGYNAQDLKPILGIKVQFREIFARVKLLIDLYLINKQPRYLGEKIVIGA